MNKIVLSLLTTMLLACHVFSKPLDLALGARPHAMGGAFVAIADDVNAPYWNPAGMALVKSMEFGVTNQLFQELFGVNVNLLCGVVPIKKIGSVGFNWQMINAGLEEGDPDNDLDFRKDHWREHMFSLSFARQLWENLLIFKYTSVGVNLNRYTYSTEYYHGAGMGFDAGFITLLPYNIRFGLMLRSMAADMEGEMFDPEYRAGLGYELLIKEFHKLTFAADLSLKEDIEYSDSEDLEAISFNQKVFGGLEYSLLILKAHHFTPSIRLGGYMTPRNDRTQGTWGNATGGIGLAYKNYVVDYAFKYNSRTDFGLGISHHIAFTFKR
jgi:hypothetical protein